MIATATAPATKTAALDALAEVYLVMFTALVEQDDRANATALVPYVKDAKAAAENLGATGEDIAAAVDAALA